jgi:glutamate-1-semialdehyde aminotransferase
MSATQMAAASGRENEIIATLKNIVSEMSGIRASDIDVDATFIEMGAESLFMLQASHSITEKLGVKVPFRALMEEYPTLRTLAAHIEQKLPAPAPVAVVQPEVLQAAPPSPSPAAQPVEVPKAELPVTQQNIIGSSAVEQIVAQQLQIMAQQLEVMRARQSRGSAPTTVATTQPTTVPETSLNVAAKTEEQPFVPFRQISKPATSTLTEQQQRHLDVLIERVSRKTQKSKQLTQEYRQYFADSREVAGFRSLWKEILYLIIVERALGSKIWDVDGNEYLDITMGFGSLLFGHSPDFVTKALQQQVAHGMQLGPQSHLAGQVAKLVCELTGNERATFCNSGTEAVMTALRLARTVSGRTKIAMFTGSYHGTFDGVLARAERGADGKLRAVPLAPGIPASMIQDVMILTYGAEESLAEIRQHANELGAVLVEPLQSRRPDNRPSEFLQELRRITEQADIPLIFDEVVSGFRLYPGGAQELFNIKADLATYGKAAGAGMPIGIIAGKAKYMDPIDGGMWQYGDASYPRAETTLFVGTFFKHPMVMAAAWAALNHIKESGPQLQEGLNQKAQYLADTLDRYFEQEHVPIRIANCGSLFRFANRSEVKYMDLFFYHLLEKGIYVWEGRNCFISTAHTDADIEFLISKVKETVVEMRAGGFLGEAPVNTQGNGHKSITATTLPKQIPLTEGQKQLWTLAQIDPDASRAYNESLGLHIRGALNVAALRSAVQQLVNRHDALRITIDPENEQQVIASSMTSGVPLLDLSKKDNAEAFIADWQLEEARKPFDFIRGPLFRANVLRLSQQYHVLVLTIHHLVIDGWSFGVLLRELSSLYEAECRRVAPLLPPARQFSEYVQWQSQQQQGPELERAKAYWLDQYSDAAPVLELPTDRPRPSVQTYNGSRERLTIDASLCSAIKHVSARERATLFMTLLASYQVLVHRLTNQDDIIVGIPSAGQASVTGDDLVGYCINLLPLRSRVAEDASFSEYLTRSKRVLSDAYDHQIYPLTSLIKKLGVTRDPSRPPLVTVAFNLDRGSNRMQFYDLDVEVIPISANSAKFDLFLNVTDQDGELFLDMDYNSDLFDATTIHRWLSHLRTLLAGIVADPRQRLSELPLLDEQEQQQMLVEWNRTQSEFPNRSLSELFEAQAENTPDQIAVTFADERLTYRELNERANKLAHYLRRQGVETETSVGVLLERSVDLIVTVLGILKAGGAYVPLDPSYPGERLSFMLDDSGAALLLTTERLADLVPTAT